MTAVNEQIYKSNSEGVSQTKGREHNPECYTDFKNDAHRDYDSRVCKFLDC